MATEFKDPSNQKHVTESSSFVAQGGHLEDRSAEGRQATFQDFFRSFCAKAPPMQKEDLLKCYRQMLVIRRFEEKAGQIYGMGAIGGFCHLYIGQEAVAVGSLFDIQPEDHSVTSYRDHGHVLVFGIEAKTVMAELTGRAHGLCKGKGGSMHMFSKAHNFYGGHGIVGAQVSVGTGLAFANKYLNNGGVSLVYLGDGAANQGQVYESFNMAALWQLPAIYILENNRYAMGTAVKRATAEVNFARHGLSCGVPGVSVDGMDVESVRKALVAARAWVHAGNGPVLLDMETYRYRGHSMSDPAQYRTKEEVQEMRTKYDPIEKSKKQLLEKKWASEDDLKEIEKSVRSYIAEAAQFAQTDPEPDEAELYTDILA